MQEAEWISNSTNANLSNPNCQDPERILEYIALKPSDLFYELIFYHKKTENETVVRPDMTNRILSKSDDPTQGRCFTVTPTKEMIQLGIRKIDMELRTHKDKRTGNLYLWGPKFILHTPGMFMRRAKKNHLFTETWAGVSKSIELEYEIHNSMERSDAMGRILCVKSEMYDVDNCIEKDIEEMSMAKYGCTTPFGPDKTHICTNQTLGKDALKIYQTVWKTLNTRCSKSPCRVIYTRLTNGQDQPFSTWTTRSKVTITLAENVRIIDEIPLYSLLSMVAEAMSACFWVFLSISYHQLPVFFLTKYLAH